jgi:hypothetical protein
MRFVPTKSEQQQSGLMLHRSRQLLVRQRTMLSNAIRGHMAELGIISAKGRNGTAELLQVIAKPRMIGFRVLDYKIICPLGSKLLPTGKICTQHAGTICWTGGCLSLPHWVRDSIRYAGIGYAIRHPHLVLACSRHMQGQLEAVSHPSRSFCLLLVRNVPSNGGRRENRISCSAADFGPVCWQAGQRSDD